MSSNAKDLEITWEGRGENRAQVVSIQQGSEILGGISPWTLRKWAQDGKLATVKIGGRRMIPVSELRRAVAGELK